MLCTELCNCWGGSRSHGKSLSHLNVCSYQTFCYVAKKSEICWYDQEQGIWTDGGECGQGI